MKYQAPYGSSDPDEEYVDRNSSAATSGSKLPAGFPNWTQREIVNVIKKAGFTPDDVLQLAAAIQSGGLNYGVLGGTANALAATLLSAPPALVDGLTVVLTIGVANTGAATLNVNGLGALPIVNLFGAPLVGGELVGPVRFTYGAAKWWAAVVQPSVSADRTYYVNSNTGSDSNSGLTSGTAFATIQKAVDVVASINWAGYAATISVANGTYGAVSLKNVAGASSVTLTGNVATPASVVTGAITANGTSGWKVEGLKPTTTVAAAHNLQITGGSVVVGTMEWPVNDGGGTSNGGAHMAAGAGGSILVTGTQRIAGGATIAHMYVADGGAIRFLQGAVPALNVLATVGFTQFVNAVSLGNIHVTYASITGAANVNTGKKYNATANGIINTDGAGVGYYPGPTAGTTATGGQYV
ncbi:hypothetical protein G6N76_10900 [Rhizobium daejeonense]|uniref:Uncharacterized protein n=1 Tax=Rhizobium daejeonense TaxID=240521 RepID=A0A6M1RZ88_9HYPH|nr:hypothetical protein [Rhizobium daejeonense]NGO64185.1 hypothetical protein [Rhizobium daejeonense]